MDKTEKKNILLGLFVMIGIVIFIIGIFLVGSKNELFKKTAVVTANFTNATGLKSGSNVRFNGVKVGIVKSVLLINDTLVQVDMQIEDTKLCYITGSAIASIGSDGLMGDKIINIVAGKSGGTPIRNNDIIQSRNPLVTDQVMQTLSTTNENVRVISENLKVLTTDLNSENGTIQSLYKDPKMANNLKQSFSNLNLITERVLTVSAALQQITAQMENGDGTIGQILKDTTMGKNLAYTMKRLKETSDQLASISDQLAITMQHVNTGKGTASLLLTDTALASNIQQSVINIKSASKRMDEDMEALKHNFLTRGYFKKQERKKRE